MNPAKYDEYGVSNCCEEQYPSRKGDPTILGVWGHKCDVPSQPKSVVANRVVLWPSTLGV